ncbi:MAG: hypothetical protein Q7T55_25400 [Solirubrobacteraceae bacterium]|nr:hypothetical protein [Solirubrobacteraceae bacterium]
MSRSSRRPLPRRVTGRRPAVALALMLLAVVAPSTASAKASISQFAAGPLAPTEVCDPNLSPERMATTAAARTDFCVAFYFDGGPPSTGDDVRTTIANTPQGFLATADTSPQCTLAQYAVETKEKSNCPENTQVGEGEARIRVDIGFGQTIYQTVKAKIWNLEHSKDEVAGIGIELRPALGPFELSPIKLKSRTTLRPNPDVGLTTIIDGQPREATIPVLGNRPIALDGFFLRFWGSKTDHPSMPQSFALLGSDCSKDQLSTITGVTYSGEQTNATDSYRLTDCDKAPFGVQTKVTTSERRPDVNTSVTVELSVDQNEDPKVTANMGKTVLTLPAGLELGAQLASGPDSLPLCTAAQFGWDRSERSTCPAASQVGDVTFISPLQANEFSGAAYVGEQPAEGELPQLFIEGGFGTAPDSPRVKLRGTMKIDADGRIESTLDDLPQVLFRTFRLTFRGGEHSAMVTPRQCGTTTGYVEATPASDGIARRQELPLTIDEDCIDPNLFTPSIAVSTANPQAGARTVTTVDTVRPDRQARITKVVANLPAGIISDLNLATECTVDQAAAFACPETSRIGTVTSTSGVGPKPLSITGDVYLRTRDEGAVAGVVIMVPVKFGGVDLGKLNVAARIELRQPDLGLRFIADVPTRYKGLSLNLRSFSVALDRPGFAINPTNCSPLSSVSSLFSDRGAQADVPSTFRVSGCEKLSFDPGLAFSLTGKTGQGDKPSLGVKVSLPAGGSNIKSTRVVLPDGIGADLVTARRACPGTDWDAGTCSPDAITGKVTATLSITSEVVSGTVSLVKVAGEPLPGIGIQLQGRFAARILGTIAIDQKSGQLVTNLPSLPDVPLTVFDLQMEGGPRGALISTKKLCSSPKVSLKGSFVGQSGATAERTATTNCGSVLGTGAALVKVSGSARKGLTFKISAPTGKTMRSLKFGLPSGVAIPKAKVGKKKLIRGTKVVSLAGKRTLVVSLPKAGRATITVKVPKGALSVTKKLAKKKTFTISTRIGYAGGTRDSLKTKVKP